MERYIGLDVHATSCTLAVVGPSGRRLRSMVVETNGAALVEALRLIPGRRRLCFEEGTQSAWLHEILRPHVEELVVTQMRTRRRGTKNDKVDAFGLADALRLGKLESRVFKDPSRYSRLRELARAHDMLVHDVVRIQQRLKSVFRGRGIRAVGRGAYLARERQQWLGKLPDEARELAKPLYDEYDAVSEIAALNKRQMLEEVRSHEVAHVLQTCPGMGWIRVAQLLPVVITPHRFRTKRQFWSYCGFGVVTRSSSDWVQAPVGGWVRAKVLQTRGLNRKHHPVLKNIFKGAAHTILTQTRRGPLYDGYHQMLESGGTKPNLAKVTLARKVAATVLKMWKTGEVYRADERDDT
jgi:transposase